jgi:hypothetical protein
MRSFLYRLAGWIVAAAVLALLAAGLVTWHKRREEIDPVSDEQKVARSLGIIRTSTPADRKVLKVLFYGQSITASGWDKSVLEHWREKYPNTVFVEQNRALGGFASPALERTTEQDIAAFYPDLIVFQVYGDHRAYERILRMFRSLTAADVILQNDHGNELPELPCAEGLQLSLHRQPGCAGLLWVHQRVWEDEMSYHKIPSFAKQYGLAVEPQRLWWRDYLLRNRLPPQALLIDHIHPNAAGKQLLADFFEQYFDSLVEHWNGETEHNVVSLPPNQPRTADGQETIGFDGSRLELLSSQPLSAWPTVLVDGEAPRQIDGCYQVTRANLLPTGAWPVVRRITLRHDRTAEDWTATLTGISADQSAFTFSVKGSVTGDDGAGDSTHDFVSKSGELSIQAEDWMPQRAFELTHTPLPDPYPVHWSVQYVCGGEPEAIDLGGGRMQYRYVLATGLVNGAHTVKLSFAANTLAKVTEFRAYRPPLH